MGYLIAFLACVPAANWLIHNVGTTCIPDGPCLVPVGFGLMAPSGVLVIGAAFVLRDVVHLHLGRQWVLGAIVSGAALSFFVASPALAIASGVAFLLSELLDYVVYTPLAARRFMLAVIASSLVGAVADSVVFLWLAFDSLEYLAGQVVGKWWAILLLAPVAGIIRNRMEARA